MPMITRATINVGRLWATPPSRPPASTAMAPLRNTRRGPNSTASLPAVGCATALARYNAATSTEVRPTGMRKS